MSNHVLDRYEPKHTPEEKSRRKSFGKACETLRLDLGLSLSGMAKRLNVSEELMVRIENGKVSPEAPGIQRKLDQLQCNEKMVIA